MLSALRVEVLRRNFAKKKMSKQKTETEMFPLVADWESSKENQELFCKNNGISISVFSYWRSKYRKRQRNSAADLFTALEPESTSSIELTYPNGVKISLPKYSELSMIQALIRLG
ncbi:MAG TPA: hypothetical protein DCR48_03640 [Flavobacteriales bacterium]|nr:hypothetical protein [Flavobacteriales bacterium]